MKIEKVKLSGFRLFLFIFTSLLFINVNNVKSIAAEQGFIINQNEKNQLTIDALPFTVFAIKDKIIYPGSQGSGTFVIKNNSEVAITYELLVKASSPEDMYLPIIYTLKKDSEEWLLSKSKTNDFEQELSVKQEILANKTETYKLIWQWPKDKPQDQSLQEAVSNKELVEKMSFKLKVENREIINNDNSDAHGENQNNQKNTEHDSLATTNKLPKRFPKTGEIVDNFVGVLAFIILLFISYQWSRKRQRS